MPNITQGILPILLAPGLNESQWEFGYYQLSNVNEIFNISKVNNWQNNPVFRGVDDGYYYVVARMKARHNVFDFKRELLNCNAGTCVLQILAATRVTSASSCILRIVTASRVISGGGTGGGQNEEFSGIVLLGRNI